MRRRRGDRDGTLGWGLSLLLGLGLAVLFIWACARYWNGAELTLTVSLRLPGGAEAVERVETGDP